MPSRFKCLLMEPFGTALSTLSGQKPNVCRIKTTAWFPTLSFDLRAHGFDNLSPMLPNDFRNTYRHETGRRLEGGRHPESSRSGHCGFCNFVSPSGTLVAYDSMSRIG